MHTDYSGMTRKPKGQSLLADSRGQSRVFVLFPENSGTDPARNEWPGLSLEFSRRRHF